MVDFPLDDDHDYDFAPRPLDSRPPAGPIGEDEFYDYFYHYSPAWRRCRPHILSSAPNNSALGSLPKRKLVLDMEDGQREVFWGIYAVERRSFRWLLAYGCLCNVPGVIFFFLWLFQWKHASDLQDGSVPVMLSASLTAIFVALLYESRQIR